MNKLVASVATMAVICAVAYAPIGAAAEMNANNAALQNATAQCRAQVKQYAQFHETSWYQRHKMVKSCVKEALAKK
jgi:hypothetical protein